MGHSYFPNKIVLSGVIRTTLISLKAGRPGRRVAVGVGVSWVRCHQRTMVSGVCVSAGYSVISGRWYLG